MATWMRIDPEFVKLNHAQVRRLIVGLACDNTLARYDGHIEDIARRWYRLSQQHLRAARAAGNASRQWRCAVSRSYYAAYSASRAARYFVSGRVRLDVKDHDHVGDLPDDFPQRGQWASFLVQLRKDRNVSDYDPWDKCRQKLYYAPAEVPGKVDDFLRHTRDYLRQRGIAL